MKANERDLRQDRALYKEEWEPDDVHKLVIDVIGFDDVFPRRHQVLIKLYSPSPVDALGMAVSDKEINDVEGSTMVGRVLRIGSGAFRDVTRFPIGPTVTFGEWGIFRGFERQRIKRNGISLAFVDDTSFIGVTTNPEELVTHFDPIHDYAGV